MIQINLGPKEHQAQTFAKALYWFGQRTDHSILFTALAFFIYIELSFMVYSTFFCLHCGLFTALFIDTLDIATTRYTLDLKV